MNDPYFPWVLPAAFFLDLLIGDPVGLPHPIRWMGRWITSWENMFRNGIFSETTAGSLLVISLVSGTWLICAAALIAARAVHPGFALALHVVLIYYALSVKSLRFEALKVYAAMKQKELDEARQQLSKLVGRDVESLDEAGMVRATVETVAENLVDGVIAPLFYAALGGGPLAMAYKMINTLDSMIGHKNERYKRFGWFAARLDDAANFIPARISAIVISLAAPLIKRSSMGTIKTAIRDGRKHLSPNAGIPEAAFAGALGIRLGGPNYYGGHLIEKPYIGKETHPVQMEDIRTATTLMVVSAFIWLIVCWVFLIA
ncbi:MAG: cobalamin biosynthesis protein CobD [Deltaproteobacteria bacterium]|nr:cobalamin biosynthesis protein CobD [Deltaproteobacteria bacterium]MBW1796124.1 cobalamin biosynthesis protein CobD [Deltaproteobacteria bacterium]